MGNNYKIYAVKIKGCEVLHFISNGIALNRSHHSIIDDVYSYMKQNELYKKFGDETIYPEILSIKVLDINIANYPH